MSTASVPVSPTRSRRPVGRPGGSPRGLDAPGSYAWLALAGVLFALTGGRWAVPIAAWLGPLFLLRFLHARRPLPGLVLAWLVRYGVAAAVTLPGTVLLAGPRYLGVVLVIVTVAMLPYVADRLLAHRLNGALATLVLPTAATALEYLASFGPAGTIASVANTQYGDLPLVQIVSVTGIWGITFLVTWFAATFCWAWERGFDWPIVRTGVAACTAVVLAVLLGGGARLALTGSAAGADARTVRVAGISASRTAARSAAMQLPAGTLSALQAGTVTASQRAGARAAFAVLDEDLLRRTGLEADAGAGIVAWPEASPVGGNVLAGDEAALLRRAADVARRHGVYLEMGLAVWLPGGSHGPTLRDETVLVDPGGRLLARYEKTHLIPFTEQGLVVPGTGRLPVIDTPVGRLALAICFDQDFPATMRQAGRAHAGLLLGPSDDWRGLDPAHAHDATFRAVENGYALMRPASQGLGLAVDDEGRVLGASDYFSSDSQAVVADLPTRGSRTVYDRVGDLFAWLDVVALVGLTGLALGAGSRRPVPPSSQAIH